MAPSRLILDANILIRAVLGKRVKVIITTFASTTDFLAPEEAYEDVGRHLQGILTKHNRADEVEDAVAYLTQLRALVLPVPEELYLDHKDDALARIKHRDPDDWPVLAAALAFDCGIWTEDNEFFGTGVPTWTTDRVTLYLDNP